MSDQNKLADALARQYLFAFVILVFRALNGPEVPFYKTWHVKAMCRALERVKDNELNRLIFEVPPRHLKSITTTVAFSAWILGHNPTLKIMTVSYGAELAEKHARDLRAVMNSDWYKNLFPGTVIKTDTAVELITTKGGGRRAVSIGGSATGLGADIIIIDDPLKASDARSENALNFAETFYRETLFSRQNSPKTAKIIIIQQRIAEHDLVGLAKETGGFECLSFPAKAIRNETFDLGNGDFHHRKIDDLLFPEAFDQESLDDLRRNLGAAAYAAQYQQDPTAPEGNRIRMEWFGCYEEPPPRRDFTRVILSVDAAASELPDSDFSVCTAWGHRMSQWYLLELFRERLTYPRLKQRVIEYMHHWNADLVLIEKASNGIALFQDLRNSREYRGKVVDVRPNMEKALRVEAATAELETGKFLLPKHASWYPDFARELRGFPASRYDDQVDSVIQFVNWQKNYRNANFINPAPRAVISKIRPPLKQRIHDDYAQYGYYRGTR